MKYKTAGGLNLSSFMLGTVQLGLNYGVANSTGKPDRNTAFGILNAALEHGVNALDTAAGYGDSEVVIGEWLKTLGDKKAPFVATKISKLDYSSREALMACVRGKAELSRSRLDVERIPMLMLHSYEDYDGDKAGVEAAMKATVSEGIAEHIGISVYANNDYAEVAKSPFELVQIPLNVFDWRQIENGGLKKLAEAGKAIVVRSVFLQGLIFQTPEALDPRMTFAAPWLAKFLCICEKFHMKPAELAASFVLSLPGVTSLVLGCEQERQVLQNAEMIDSTKQLSAEQMEELRRAFKNTDTHVLDPRTWFNA